MLRARPVETGAFQIIECKATFDLLLQLNLSPPFLRVNNKISLTFDQVSYRDDLSDCFKIEWPDKFIVTVDKNDQACKCEYARFRICNRCTTFERIYKASSKAGRFI